MNEFYYLLIMCNNNYTNQQIISIDPNFCFVLFVISISRALVKPISKQWSKLKTVVTDKSNTNKNKKKMVFNCRIIICLYINEAKKNEI